MPKPARPAKHPGRRTDWNTGKVFYRASHAGGCGRHRGGTRGANPLANSLASQLLNIIKQSIEITKLLVKPIQNKRFRKDLL